MEIHPCVLQDIGPLGPLPKKEIEELLKVMEQEKKDNPKKKQKKEAVKEAGGESPLAASDPKADAAAPSSSVCNSVRGSYRGNWRGRGGLYHNHGGFWQNQSYQHGDVAQRYREVTPPLANASFSLSASAPSLPYFDPNAFMAVMCVLSNQALGRQSSGPVEPIATSSPVAFRQQQGRGRGGVFQGGYAPRGNPCHGQQQQQQQQQRAAPQNAPLALQRGGQRGAAPPRQ